MLPKPPITTTAKASTTTSEIISSEAAEVGTTSAPPRVPNIVPKVKIATLIQTPLTPKASLIRRFSAVALTMRPKLVFCNIQPRASANRMLEPMTKAL